MTTYRPRPPWALSFDADTWAAKLASYGANVPGVPVARFLLLPVHERTEVVIALVEAGEEATAEVMMGWHRRRCVAEAEVPPQWGGER